MATSPTPKVVTATPADIRAYFAFRAFQIGAESALPVVEIGEIPFGGDKHTRALYPQQVSREDFLRVDQSMEPWRALDRRLVKKAYLFECEQCGWGNSNYEHGLNPPGQDQACQGEEAGCVETPYKCIPAVSWSAERLLADTEARKADVDIDFTFREKPDGSGFYLAFVNEYLDFIGAKLVDHDASQPGSKYQGQSIETCRANMKLQDAPRITGTEGLIAEMRFHGRHGLFLPEVVKK